jgi:hypothetical protein
MPMPIGVEREASVALRGDTRATAAGWRRWRGSSHQPVRWPQNPAAKPHGDCAPPLAIAAAHCQTCPVASDPCDDAAATTCIDHDLNGPGCRPRTARCDRLDRVQLRPLKIFELDTAWQP